MVPLVSDWCKAASSCEACLRVTHQAVCVSYSAFCILLATSSLSSSSNQVSRQRACPHRTPGAALLVWSLRLPGMRVPPPPPHTKIQYGEPQILVLGAPCCWAAWFAGMRPNWIGQRYNQDESRSQEFPFFPSHVRTLTCFWHSPSPR